MAIRHFAWAAVSVVEVLGSTEPPLHAQVIAIAKASAASAGLGISLSFNIFVTIVVTWLLLALPLPVTAALTCVGVKKVTGMPR